MTVKTEASATAWPRPHAEPVTNARSTLNTDASASHMFLSVGRPIGSTAGDYAIGDLAIARPIGSVERRHPHRGRRRHRNEADDRQAVAEHLGEGGGGEGLGEQEALAERAPDLPKGFELGHGLDALGDGLE